MHSLLFSLAFVKCLAIRYLITQHLSNKSDPYYPVWHLMLHIQLKDEVILQAKCVYIM